jgi:hypothetical protein
VLKVDYQDEACRIGVIGSIYASAWTMMPTSAQVTRVRETFARFLERPDPVAVLIIGLDTERPLVSSDAVRAELLSVFKLGSEREGPSAAVIEAKGFIAAFVRSLLAGIFLVTRGRRKIRMFSQRNEALDWLQKELGAAAPPDLGASVTALTRDLR